MKLAKAMTTVAGLTGLSRIVGFVRDVLMAAYLGAGPIADAFFVALKIPNFFRRVTAEGAFSVAFVPLYSKTIDIENKKKADVFASNVFMVMLSALSVVTLLAVAFMPYVVAALVPGFSADGQGGVDRFDYAVEFSRITFLYLLMMSLGALLGGVLNATNRFAPFAFAPVFFNVSLIFFLFISDYFDTAGHALSWGVLVAGILQLFFLLVCARRSGFNLAFGMPRIDADVKKVLRLMGPAVIGAGVVHINLFADMIIASFLPKGSISYLYYADRLNQLPLGVVGIAVGTALLPMLSRAMLQEDKAEARDLFNRALEYCLILALPAAVALMAIPLSLVTVLFERGAFDAQDSVMTSYVLMSYACGLPAYIAIKVFSTVHWAREDTVTPVKIAAIATFLNIAFSLVLINFIGVVGIALATGLTGWLQFYLHLCVLRRTPLAQLDQKFIVNASKIILSSIVMGGVVFLVALPLDIFIFGEHTFWRIVGLGGVVISGICVYTVMLFATKTLNMHDIRRYFLKKKVN